MRKVQWGFRQLIIASLMIFITCHTNIVYSEENKTKKLDVLFISAYNSGFISFEDQVEGIKVGLNNNVNLKVEYMDLKTIASEENEIKFYNLLKLGFENYETYDAIIAGDDEALEFCLKYRNDIFKDIPISFLGIQKENVLNEAFTYEKISGVREMESIAANLELIKKFHPTVDNIIFVDNSRGDYYDDAVKKNPSFTFDRIITSELSIDEFEKAIANIKSNSAIISLYPEDFKCGQQLSDFSIIRLILNINPNLPIYNILSYDIGAGSIGGKVVNHFNQGKKAGEIVLGLLDGIDEKELYIAEDSANEYIFDYDALRRFNIKTKYLPENSKVLNHPLDIIKNHKDIFTVVCAIFIILILLIIALIKYINYKKQYEKEIIKAKNKAEEVNKLKGHFIANISHELKTPINVILCATQLLESENYRNNIDNKSTEIIKDNCCRLIRLINNIIDVEKSELNDLKLNLDKYNIVSATEELVMSIIPYAEKKNLNLIFDTDKEEVIMNIDISKFERVILNLVSNAIKFSKENSNIYVKVISGDNYVDVIIEDNGEGIPKEDIPKIFEKFMQVDNTLTRKNEGSGIGLSIVKSFVELHNGEIMVESEINKGTKFTVRLPKIIDKESNNNFSIDEKNYLCEYDVIKEISNIKYRTKTELSDIYI